MAVMANSIPYADSNAHSLAPPNESDPWGGQACVQVAAKFGIPTKDESQEDEDEVSHWQDHSPSKILPKRKSRRKNDSIWALVSQWIVEHQIGIAVNLLLLLAMTHICFPRARRHTRKFFQLSYYNRSSGRYMLGQDDILMATYWIVLLTGLRAAVMEYALMPLAQAAGIQHKKYRVRFAEQAWVSIYSGVFFSLGMFLMYHSTHWLNLGQLWEGWPDRELSGPFKWYYLVQFAFWVQQILVVHIEKRRKDHAQMFTHHVITCALILASYGYHQTKVGNLILCLMDVVDLILAFAKMLKYLGFRLACDVAFGVFLVVWFVTRHVLYLLVCYSVYAHIPEKIKYGCYWGPSSNLQGPIDPPDVFNHLIQPFKNPEGLVCWDNKIKWIFLSSLLALQMLLLIWFGMIIRVACKVIRGGEAEDSRSDDELEDGQDENDSDSCEKQDFVHELAIEVPPLEEEVGIEGISLSALRKTPSRRFRKGGGTASGVTIPSDRKELLGRIGCDKGS